ncbi:MAG TPA: hypothetical protein VE359_01010 [Vicinamibacteria bacterium]|nr:hypothetical protein [Vicinamibacteria bacterium]
MTASNGFLERERQMIAAIFSDAPGRPLGPGSIEMLAAALQGALFNVTRTLRLRLAKGRRRPSCLHDAGALHIYAVEALRYE